MWDTKIILEVLMLSLTSTWKLGVLRNCHQYPPTCDSVINTLVLQAGQNSREKSIQKTYESDNYVL